VNAPAAAIALPARLLSLVFVPFAAGFFLSFMFRNANAVISKDLATEFSLSSSELGLLTSAYFLAFAAMQMPVGIFLDRYGPRRVTAGLLLVLAAGAGAFASAEGLGSLALGRALIGVGASACLMGSMKAFSIWFPLDRMATLNGWTMAIGALGAVTATAPVEFAASLVGWRAMFGCMALITVAVAACIFFLVPEKTVPGAHELWSEQFGRIAAIFRVPAFWRLGTPMIVMQGTYQALFGLWLVPWLMDTQDLSRGAAAQWLMWAALTYAAASIFFGQGADRLAAHGMPRLTLLKWGAALAVAAFFALGFAPGVPKLVLLLAYAFGAVGPVLCYAILSRHFSVAVTGRLNTALNVSMFLWAFIVQIGTGMLLRLFPADNGRYPVEGYALAFMILGGVQLAAWVLVATLGKEPGAYRPPA
jgi:predicted MFS family arabinose efflux permease